MKPALLACAAALVAALPAQAAPTRSFQADYNGAGLAGVSGTFVGVRCGVQCLTFTTAPSGERTMRVSITDASGRAVGWAAQTEGAAVHTGCGTGVLVVGPDQTWWVSSVVLDRCQAAPTHGTLTARLSR